MKFSILTLAAIGGLFITHTTTAANYPEPLVRSTRQLAEDTGAVRARLMGDYDPARPGDRGPRVREFAAALNTFAATSRDLAVSVARNAAPRDVIALVRGTDNAAALTVAEASQVRAISQRDLRDLRELRQRASEIRSQVEAVADRAGSPGRDVVDSRNWTPVMWSFYQLGQKAGNQDRMARVQADYRRHTRGVSPLFVPYFAQGYNRSYPKNAYRAPTVPVRTPPRHQWTDNDWTNYNAGFAEGRADKNRGLASKPSTARLGERAATFYVEGYYDAYPPFAGGGFNINVQVGR